MGIVKFLAVVLALGFMFAMPKSAEAHNAPAKFHAPSSERSAPVAVKGEVSAQAVAVLSGSDEDDGCLEGCCTMTAACCSPAAISQHQLELVPLHAAFDFDLNIEAMPQGPPYSLLRPPKFSA